MAFVLPNSVFLHCPKTAGSWIVNVLTQVNISVIPLKIHMHCRHIPIKYHDKFRFAFVRHPLTWYQSYFIHGINKGWSNDHIDRHCKSLDFERFVINCIERFPQGYCSTILQDRYFEKADFVGLFERLKPDLIQALDLAEEKFDKSIIKKMHPKNISNYQLIDVSYSTKLRERVMSVERNIITRFYQ